MIRLGLNNRIDNATLTSSAAYVATLPLAHLHSPIVPKVARTTSSADFSITAAFGSAFALGCIAVAGHNLDRAGKVRFVSKLAAATVDDSGWLWAWPKFGAGIMPDTGIAAMSPTLVYFLPSNIDLDSLEISFSNTTNSAGFIQVGRIFAGERFDPSYGEEYNSLSFGLIDPSDVQNSVNGVRYVYNRPRLRTAEFDFSHLSAAEAFEGILPAQRLAGLAGEVVFANGDAVLSLVSGTNAQDLRYFEQAFLANFSQLDALKNPYFNAFSTAFKLQEVVWS